MKKHFFALSVSEMYEAMSESRKTQMRDYITSGLNRYYVSTANTVDRGWETMVFSCDEDGHVTDWCEKYAMTYDSYEEAAAGHANVVATWQP